MADVNSLEECVCGSPMSLIENADGKQIYLCTECGISDKHVNNFDEPYFSIEAYDHGAGKNFVGVDGEGAKAPEGFRNFNKKNMISIGRKAALNVINNLCHRFSVPQYIKKEMIDLLQDKQLRSGRFETMAYAVFLHIHARWNHKPRAVTLNEVADVACSKAERKEEAKQIKGQPKRRGRKIGMLIKPKDIKIALNSLSKKYGNNQPDAILPETSSEDDGMHFPKWVMPVIDGTLKCPFTYQDISPRVMKLTEKLLEVVYRRITTTPALIYLPLAASYLAFQSCFFYRSVTKTDVPPGVHVKRRIVTVVEYLTTIGFKYTKADLNAFRKNLVIVRNVLKQLLTVMSWIRPSRYENGSKETLHAMTRRYLDEILRFSNWSIGYLVSKEDAERAALPFTPPPLPKELTDAERAALESTELNDKDLSEAEANEYLRDPEQVRALEEWIFSGSEDTDDEE